MLSSTNSSPSELAGTIDSILGGEIKAWPQVAHLLDQVDQTNYWKPFANSFSAWLKDFAKKSKLNENSYWRYLTAGRYYVALRKILAQRGSAYPPLPELSSNVSPENLELLAKLARVAPIDVFDSLSEQVLTSVIRRTTLRNAWSAYRPALGGKTSRGLGVEAPTVDVNEEAQRALVAKARFLITLSSADRSWTGTSSPEFFQLFLQISPDLIQPASAALEFDAVVLVKASATSPCQLHTIQYPPSLGSELMSRLELIAPFSDFLWIAVDHVFLLASTPFIPDYVGVLHQVGDQTIVLRPAAICTHTESRVEEMLKGLLLRALKH